MRKGLKPACYENKINSILNKARDSSGTCVQNDLDVSNNFHAMVTSGSKGSIVGPYITDNGLCRSTKCKR